MTTKLMTGLEEINTLMNSRRRAILVTTYEEERFQEDMKSLVEQKGYHGYAWSITAGVSDIITGEVKQKIYDPIKIMDHIAQYDEQAVFIIKDFHDIWTNYQAKRKLRDILESADQIYKPLVLVSPTASIPAELEKIITVVPFELPNRDQVVAMLESMEEYLRLKDLEVPSGREREAIIHALTGMTQSEVVNVLKKSVAKNRKIELAEIVAEKEQVIRKTGLLEYITKLGDMSNVGGMDMLKAWAADAYFAFDPEARNYNVDAVRGMVLTGPPGTGKSLSAKAIAFDWNLPLLKMNMGDIMDSRVGQSEKNIARALKLAEAVSPCVLWMDEFEKGLSGLGSSDKSDAGTMSRVIQEILTWLSEKTAAVFVVATANDVTKLPPELTRAGRFDAVMFVSLPHEAERFDILSIHLKKRGYEVDPVETATDATNWFGSSDLKRLAETMKDFSGAEIEQVVAEAGRRSYAAYRKNDRAHHHITLADLQEQVKNVVPLAKRDPLLMAELRRWAKQSAKCASSSEHAFLHNEYKEENKPMLRTIPDLEFND
ncbi:AAA+-type ATPase, SpoVK/Ycf46/Vps4 family [Paenibacillus sp. UNC496MF]|uniref:AAA family ATPase n=1 Tax=Paenibacillus sp. UNC496MF TaxID=1502753 RepID=UPI0008E9B19A|nr:AAA family ATPase [Paenibacillus sp. UNC496MF]SFJ63798.1 AAA+-type ATPase, SpoVK/Ycf46/Vps4 family [Paenibacillus sp. UNC496MF]